MKSLMQLIGQILADAGIWCCASTSRDLKTIATRTKHEGLSFLAITLPTFCQEFERSLANGKVDSTAFSGFHKRGALPRFLGGLLRQVFCPASGDLLDSPSLEAIFFIRQTCLTCKKIESACSDARVRATFDSYIETNLGVRDWEANLESWFYSNQDPLGVLSDSHDLAMYCPPQLSHFREVSKLLWNNTTLSADFWSVEKLKPKHGPGATAEKIVGNDKFNLRTWHERLEPSFPSDAFAIPSWNFLAKLDEMQYLDPEHETPVRVIHVPKTLKGPRVIAIEPVCMQYTQQALMARLVPRLESYPLYRGALGFTDQTVNQEWAKQASSSGCYATIDLKDASDRVPARLVWDMLDRCPLFREALFACRSLRADVPGHGITPLYRFASMGSGMCFPVEAMVFYTIIVAAISRSKGLQPTISLINEISRAVRVYGDDIIVPTEYAQIVQRELEWFNLRVNSNKTFELGKFRESCGMDAYDGVQVTPVYLRRKFPTARHNTKEILSMVSLRNQFYEQGLWRTVRFLDEKIRKLIPFPNVEKSSPIKGRFSYLGAEAGDRFDKDLQVYLVKGIVTAIIPRKSPLSDSGALMKYFLRARPTPNHWFDEEVVISKEHLEYYGRPESVYTKIRWALPY